jgi:Tol biopolymer transport system component
MKRITPLILLIFISLTLMISIGCSIFGGSGKSTIISGGIGSGGSSGGGGSGGGGSGGGGGTSQQYKIVFENSGRIYIVNEDGSNQTLLDDSPNIEENAMWSPQPINNIYKILFLENDQLAIINEDGTGKQILVNDNTHCYFPMWSPTGNRIAFIKVPGQGSYGDLCSVNLNGIQQQLTTDSKLPVEPLITNLPMWDPNSTDSNYRITFLKDLNNNGHFDIYLFSSSNEQSTPLTSSSDVISFAAWSKDGDKIAYVKYNNGNKDIFVRDMNTSSQEYQITNTPASESFPIWSPVNNDELLFVREGDIYKVNISDINNPQIQPIVSTSQNEVFAVWRPDGNKIAFMRDNGNNDVDIIVRDLNTGYETNLTQNLNGIAKLPMWSPVPR